MKHFSRFGKRFLFLNLFVSFSISCFAQTNEQIENLVKKYSKQNGLDKDLVKSIIQVSSAGDPKAKSESGSAGLMQLAPSVVKDLAIKNPFDAEQNIKGGCAYLKMLMNQFNNLELAVAAFNAGPAVISKTGKVPSYPETKNFVEAVMNLYKALKEEAVESELYGAWLGTARYTRYDSKPPLDVKIVGTVQPFDLEIISFGSGVILRNSNKQLGDIAMYKTDLEKDKLHVTYSGPNPFATPIPNTTAIQTMDYTLDVYLADKKLKGEFSARIYTKVHFNTPELKLPDSEAEINYTMVLDLKRK